MGQHIKVFGSNSVNGKDEFTRMSQIILTFLDKEFLSKEEILKRLGVDLKRISPRGYYSDYFASLNKSNVIQYNKNKRLWMRGPKYHEYLGIIVCKLIENNNLRYKFFLFFKKYSSNALTFLQEIYIED